MSGLGLDPVRQVREVGIDRYRAGLGEYLDTVMGDAWAQSPVMQLGRLARTWDAQERAEASGERLMTAEEASAAGHELGLRFDRPISRGAFDVLSGEKRRQAAAESVFKRARLEDGYGTLAWLLGGGAEFLTMAADPLNIASAFVPVVREARYAAMAARLGRFPAALAKGAIEGAAGQAMLEPLTALDRAQLGDEYTLLDTLTSLAFGAGLGVTLHGAAYGAGAGFRFIRDRYRVAEPEAGRTPDVLMLREDQLVAGEPRRLVTVEKIDEPPPRQPVAEQMERLRPETKEAAMRTAIAQLAQDKPVDVEPVLRADPNWGAIRQEIARGHREVPELQARSAETAKGALPSIEPPADWQPTPDELRLATRVARGWEPEKPLDRPQSLVDFVRKNGGLIAGTAEAAELQAADLGRQPGLLRSRERGRQADHMAQAVADAGYRFGQETATGSGVNVDAFVKALIEDAGGRRKHFPDDAHTTAWRAQQEYFEAFKRNLEELGIPAKGMEPRQLAWLLAQDRDTARLMSLVARIDSLGDDASLELVARLDAEREALAAEIAREPGAVEPDAVVDHREVPAATLEELERYHAEHQGTAGPGETGRQAAGRDAAAGRAPEGGETPPARPARGDAAPEAAGLRPEGPEGTARAEGDGRNLDGDTPTPEELARFAERQHQADLHADPAALDARDARLAEAERELQQLLQDDLRDHAHLIDDDTRLAIEETGRRYDDDARATDALAACQMRGGA